MTLSQKGELITRRRDLLNILFLIIVAVIIFYPVFYTEFAYTDDFVLLWLYKTGSAFHPSIVYGRYLTEELAQTLFSRAITIHDVINIRTFSFFGWLICVPIWYIVIKRIVEREKLPSLLTFFSVLYLVCTPCVSVYVRWASCFEQFIAYTAGLLSGYILYAFIEEQSGKLRRPVVAIAGALVLGIIALFTYQNGFGCFLLPFLLHVTSKPKTTKLIFIIMAVYLGIYVVYYLLFKFSLHAYDLGSVERTTISFNILPKIRFFFRPLATAFHFTLLFNEKSITGFIIYVIIFFAWISVYFRQHNAVSLGDRLKLFALTISLLALIYLPSLVVRENYFSNRTLLALNMGVFFLVAHTILTIIKKEGTKTTVVAIISSLFVLNARYNFIQEFLNPVKTEYKKVRAYLETNYNSNVTSIYFIRPHEDFFVTKYHITRSWDEFGVPSTFFDWVPEFFTKQVVFEKTGDRKTADNLTVKHWLGKEQYLKQPPAISPNSMVVDVEQILNQ